MFKVNGEIIDERFDDINIMLKSLGYRSEIVVVELNGEIVSRSDFEKTPIRDGDKVEIVCFVGGG